jgi:5-(carboxyamino)imidazole ribonucleotide mutase
MASSAMVGIIMGSDSDLNIMQAAAEVLKTFNIPFELTVVSAHRTPERMVEYAKNARERGLKVIIAGAGGAAHLPGMVAAITSLPVIGVPIKSSNSIDGWDSVLSILQMPGGVPVATVALNGAKNAGLLAAQIIGSFDAEIGKAMEAYKNNMEAEVLAKVEKMKDQFNNEFDQ